MKRKTINIYIFVAFLAINTYGLGQGAPPPPPLGGGAGGSNNQPAGGGAPIGGGLGILLALSAAYGSNKMYNAFKKHLEE